MFPALDALERSVAESSARPVPIERAAPADQVGFTARERTMLRYVPTRLSNREITYRKLGVESRAAAIERTRHLDLL